MSRAKSPAANPHDTKRVALYVGKQFGKRLNTASVLTEQFGQPWDYQREPWARKFFDQWRAALRWQRLEPFETFAELIERHWDGITACGRPENTVALGFVDGLNNKTNGV